LTWRPGGKYFSVAGGGTGEVVANTNYAGLGVRVAASSIGWGVFALRPFPAKTTVGRMRGRTYRDPDYQSDYCVDLGGSLSLEPAAPFRYLNHSCDPNCVLVNVGAWNARRRAVVRQIWVHSRRRIVAGEELTIDYAWPADAAIPCMCGSRKCRGWIVAKDELGQLLSRSPSRTTRQLV
jgi:hypothetical protein